MSWDLGFSPTQQILQQQNPDMCRHDSNGLSADIAAVLLTQKDADGNAYSLEQTAVGPRASLSLDLQM